MQQGGRLHVAHADVVGGLEEEGLVRGHLVEDDLLNGLDFPERREPMRRMRGRLELVSLRMEAASSSKEEAG